MIRLRSFLNGEVGGVFTSILGLAITTGGALLSACSPVAPFLCLLGIPLFFKGLLMLVQLFNATLLAE
ncbi:MAG: hypothetical protein COT26_00025 [Candidatus Kerfeldbacteria bacterium CG08_land_8_20_14_0_20_43_14]|uniref:Uncharacterized protein n=1 Tax=Candidatus Kerfeldbacteria bacterium CG08_land_8_20_14_0_20_43_14 TaxID=2014246 RepID=A0A2H0YRY3_9BACT|nr:MAG: hypothetical protein COT26_00025 [Candidatus Kerfeldbacteria bacterium CG08_land_8_20_14_0_20_43_14]